MWHAAGQHAGGECRELATRNAAEAVLHRVADGAGAHMIKPLTADPVGLNDSGIKRIGKPGRGGNQLQIRPRPRKLPSELAQTAIVGSCNAVGEERLWSPGPQYPWKFGGNA